MEFLDRVEALISESIDGSLACGGIKDTADAMKYSVLGGGKRLRALLCRAFAMDDEKALYPAAAIECIHAYSLIHDDLPAMDNDDFRRGKPSCHKAFSEATAILAGDGLQTLAFSIIAKSPLSDVEKVKIIGYLSDLAGVGGMVGGQTDDLYYEGKSGVGESVLNELHRKKTGCLIAAAALTGAAVSGEEYDESVIIRAMEALGLAFQIQDDLLDETGTLEVLGKMPHSDKESGKSTYFTLYGKEKCTALAEEKYKEVIEILKCTPFMGDAISDIVYKMKTRDR